MTYIEQLLAKIEDAEAKAQFTGLIEKNPFINDYIVDPESKSKHDAITQWAESEWDYEHGMSRLEYQQQQQLVELQGQVANRKDGMELNELNDHLGKFMKDNGLITKAEYEAGIAAKEAAFSNELNLVSTLATRVPYLNAKYQKDFGEMFDPDAFVSQANEKGYAKYGKEGLDRYYDEFTADKRTAKQAADLEALKVAERADERKKVLQEMHMGEKGQMPTLDGSPEMGHFEARMKGMNKPADGTQSAAPADAELGRGTIARFAANAAEARDRAALVN